MRRSRRLAWSGIAFGILILLHSSASFAKSPPKDAQTRAGAETLMATVCACDPEGSTFDLVTGCGLALHEVRISVSPASKLTRNGKAVRLSDLKPGTLVRVRFVKSKDLNVAEAVEVTTWEEER